MSKTEGRIAAAEKRRGGAQTAFDVAVFGSSAAALLVAGLLRTAHGKSVVLVGEGPSSWLLPRRFDLALPVATRPETWRLLKSGLAETRKLLGGIGRNLVGRVDPVLVAERPATLEAIAHMRATLSGFGFSMERVADRTLAEPAAAFCLRDVASLEPAAGPAIAAWAAQHEVRTWRGTDGTVILRRNGLVQLTGPAGSFEAERAVLMDDAALLAHLSPEEVARLFASQACRSIRTEPAAALTAPLLRYLDRGVSLSQPGKGMSVTAIVSGQAEHAARLGSTLSALAPLRRIAEARYQRLESRDGAPLVTLARAPRSLVVAGLGDAAAFFAPALARHIAGVAVEAEAAFFAAHDLGRGQARQAVADFVVDPA
jgi:hypothetical protein